MILATLGPFLIGICRKKVGFISIAVVLFSPLDMECSENLSKEKAVLV
jgi:hypothetical protein